MKNGVYLDLPHDQYCSEQALSASGCWDIVNDCPAVFWYRSPWNPLQVVENKTEFDIGTAAHLAILEPDHLEGRVKLVNADNWRTNAARAMRDDAYAEGLIPLLPKDLLLVSRLADALQADHWAGDLLDGARVEVSAFWNYGDVACKLRADIISRDMLVMADIKTCDSGNPRDFQRAAFSLGYFLRAAWYIDGWEQASGKRVHDYWFILIGKEPPNIVTVCRLSPRALAWGRMMYQKAVRTFSQCQRTGKWPVYCEEPATIELPTWAEYQLADREQAGDFSSEDIRRGMEFLEP